MGRPSQELALNPSPAGSRPTSKLERALLGDRCMTLLVVLGLGLRAWAYFASAPLWLDEILLSRSVLGLSAAKLATGPLLFDQVAPRGFLLLGKLATLLMGRTELALRVVPFLSGVAGLFLFRSLVRRVLEGLAAPLALAMFAIAVPFIRFGAEAKQYETDASVAILLILLALRLCEPAVTSRRQIATGFVGLAVVWFSQASVLVMAGIGLGFALLWMRSRDQALRGALLRTIPLWGIASVLALFVAMRGMSASTHAFMNDFWAPGFLPLPLGAAADLGWLWQQALSLFSDPTLLRYPAPAFFLVLAAVGYVQFGRTRRELAWILLGPMVVAVVAACAHQYPLRGRVMLYLLPGLLLAVAAGATATTRYLTRGLPGWGEGLAVLLLGVPTVTLAEALPPYDNEHAREVLSYLQQHRQEGDVIYVLPLQRLGFLFYGGQYGLGHNDFVTGVCDRDDMRVYLRDLDRFRGVRRFWFFSAGAGPFRPVRGLMKRYLSTVGVRRDNLQFPSLSFESASLELFDLSDASRLAASSADTFPAGPMPTNPKPGCRPWARPSPMDEGP